MPNDPTRTRLNQLYFQKRKLLKTVYTLAPDEVDGTDLDRLKAEIKAGNLGWVFDQLETWHSNKLNGAHYALGLLEENFKLKMEMQVEMRDRAEFVIQTAETELQAESAAAVVEDVNEWLSLSVESARF